MMRIFYAFLVLSGLLSRGLADRQGLLQNDAVHERDTAPFDIPYNLQEGAIKYAPMQPVPPTAITATNTSPLWPASSVVIANTFMQAPIIQTTVTQANTHNTISHANMAAAQSMPVDDMERFLNRWKD